jgi:hypothetical protein
VGGHWDTRILVGSGSHLLKDVIGLFTWTGSFAPAPLLRIDGLKVPKPNRQSIWRWQGRPFADENAEVGAFLIFVTIAHIVANQCSIKSLGLTILKSRPTIRRLAP